ncbi:MAG: ice-binding family protein [Rubrivivax sp.]|nr:ice-binding family protein [Rubrivivax sp.]
MNPSTRSFPLSRIARGWLPALTLPLALLAACGGGGLDPILGTPPVARAPMVSATTPLNSTPAVTGVAGTVRPTVTFDRAMTASTLTPTSFSLACPTGTPVSAGVAYDATSRTATLTPAATLPASTTCVATVSTAALDSLGFAMTAPYAWSFVTAQAIALDTTRPTVTFGVPAAAATGVATNTRISATFSEALAAASVTGTTFTVFNDTAGVAVAGTVSYSATTRTATFAPTAVTGLAASATHTATLGAGITDVAGNALAGNTAVLPAAGAQVWSFTTGATADTTAPTITAINPADGSTGACLGTVVSATFSEPVDTATLTATNFGVSAGVTAVTGSVSYDAPTRVATFTPSNTAGFAPSTALVATVRSGATGVRDLAGNPLAADRVWNFTTGTAACLGTSVNLGSAASYGAFGGGAGVTNQGINTVIGGNIGTTAACTLVTGLHDATNVYTETPLNVGVVNGSIQCGPPAPGTTTSLAVATQARADAQTAYNTLAALPPGSDPAAGQLGGLTLAPAVYTAAGGTFAITSGDLVLDAQGNAGAVWVFQSASALTVGLPATPRRVVLINGAQAKNVWWQVGSAGRIEDGSTMVGTIIAPAGVTVSTAGQAIQTTLIGRALGLTASVTLVNTTIVAP